MDRTWCSYEPRAPRDTLTLNGDPTARAPVQGGVAHFGFRLRRPAQLDEAIDAVEAAGGRLVERGAHAPGQLFAYVSDPDGYIIEL